MRAVEMRKIDEALMGRMRLIADYIEFIEGKSNERFKNFINYVTFKKEGLKFDAFFGFSLENP